MEPRDEGGTAGLTLDEAAILSEFGYDTRWTARVARRRGGPPRLARMVRMARAGRLPFRELPPPRWPGPSRVPRRAGAAPVVSLAAFLAVALLMLAFTTGAVVLLSRVTGPRGPHCARSMPWWAAAALVLVPLGALALLARWRGPLAMRGRGDGPEGVLPALLGLRAVPRWARGPACLPLLTLVPVYASQRAARIPAPGVLEFTTVLLLGLIALTVLNTGGPSCLVVLLAAWAGWAWCALRGPATAATLALLGVTLAVGAPYALVVRGRLRGTVTADRG